ncbi:MAG: hypothetical protein ABIY51_14380 [Ferruginibacter sp.]
MKSLSFLAIIYMFIPGCNSNSSVNQKVNDSLASKSSNSKASFFPVTNFIKGEIYGIKQAGINPLQIINSIGKVDSAWLKIENLDQAFDLFLNPVIDSISLIDYFNETSFLDQSIAAYTFTYEPSRVLPASITLKRWDVYIDQESNKVKRIYMLKQSGDTIRQLTWQAGDSAKIVTLLSNNNEEEIQQVKTIQWRFKE